MKKWYHIFPENTGVSLYIWLVFCILPFYFIFKSFSTTNLFIGMLLTLLFFIAYRLSFTSDNWSVYLWISLGMCISIFMSLYFGYIYFALFLAFFIGNIQHKAGFITLYVIHLVGTIATINMGFFTMFDLFYPQLPFIIICLIGVILLPFNVYNHNKREKLEGLLDDANEKISQLMIIQERQRISRDLHDTLGQKLSLIGLKSDLAGKLIDVNPEDAKLEMSDIQQTARTALKEVREMVSDMRRIKLADELVRVKQMLKAKQIDVIIEGTPTLIHTSLFTENILSMCLKEAVTNVVKHSHASVCHISYQQSKTEMLIKVQDNGIGINKNLSPKGHGLQGMKERLAFMNGQLDIDSTNGTTLYIRLPHIIQPSK